MRLPCPRCVRYHPSVTRAKPNGVPAMFRSFAAFAAALTLAAQAPAADAKKLSIRWHGQAFFEIQSSKGVRIAIDPHAIDAFGRKELKKVDFICLSHNHNDHTQVGVIQNGKDTKTYRGLLDK